MEVDDQVTVSSDVVLVAIPASIFLAALAAYVSYLRFKAKPKAQPKRKNR